VEGVVEVRVRVGMFLAGVGMGEESGGASIQMVHLTPPPHLLQQQQGVREGRAAAGGEVQVAAYGALISAVAAAVAVAAVEC
jgi:hypothetical protein